LKNLKIFRIFEEICTLQCERFTFHPTSSLIAGYCNNELLFYNLNTLETTTTPSEEIYYLTWSKFYSHTVLLLSFKSHVELRLNGHLPLVHLYLGPKVIHVNLFDDLLLTIQEPCVFGLTVLTHDTLDNISYLSSLSQDLSVNVGKIQVVLDRLGIALDSLGAVYLKFNGILESAGIYCIDFRYKHN
jgi:hypothetical protein